MSGFNFVPVPFWRGVIGIICLYGGIAWGLQARSKSWWIATTALIAIGLLLMFEPA